jgi:hypothetical protein
VEAPDPIDVTQILSDDDLAVLRRGYDREGMNRMALASVTAPYPPATPFVEFVVGHFFDASRWPPAERELCLVCMFAQRPGPGGLFLAIHLYWGLMEGLSPTRLADAFLLVGSYGGLDVFNAGVTTLRRVLLLLRRQATRPDAEEACRSSYVINRLRDEFV